MLEFIREMSKPRDFPLANASAMSLMIAAYLLVVVVACVKRGQEVSDFLPDSMAEGPAKTIAAALLAFHTMVAYVVCGALPCHCLCVTSSTCSLVPSLPVPACQSSCC